MDPSELENDQELINAGEKLPISSLETIHITEDK